jgi:hypothetical protein
MTRSLGFLALPFALLASFSPAAAGQDPALLDSPFPKSQITIALAFPIGPAVDSDQGGMYGGLAFSGGFNFTRRPSAAIGLDGQLIVAGPVEIDEWDVEGTFAQLSVGLPMRLGRAVSFFFRPGLCFERFDSTLSGTEDDGDFWEADFDSSVAMGLCLGFGLDILLGDRFSMGLTFQMSILPVAHEADTYWTDHWTSETGTKTGFITVAGVWRFSIHL